MFGTPCHRCRQLSWTDSYAYIYDGGAAPAEQVSLSSGAVTYLVVHALGSVRGTANSSGALTGAANYDAWGNPETAGGLTAMTPFGYAGGYTDPDGLIYLVDRYYDPQTGQFKSVDPAISRTLEPYEYANGNPVDNADPTGTQWISVGSIYSGRVRHLGPRLPLRTGSGVVTAR